MHSHSRINIQKRYKKPRYALEERHRLTESGFIVARAVQSWCSPIPAPCRCRSSSLSDFLPSVHLFNSQVSSLDSGLLLAPVDRFSFFRVGLLFLFFFFCFSALAIGSYLLLTSSMLSIIGRYFPRYIPVLQLAQCSCAIFPSLPCPWRSMSGLSSPVSPDPNARRAPLGRRNATSPLDLDSRWHPHVLCYSRFQTNCTRRVSCCPGSSRNNTVRLAAFSPYRQSVTSKLLPWTVTLADPPSHASSLRALGLSESVFRRPRKRGTPRRYQQRQKIGERPQKVSVSLSGAAAVNSM